jgi:hypothetical protein
MRHDHFVHVSGIFQSFNLSPKGTPEGFVCRQGNSTFQVNFPPELASKVAERVTEGGKMEAEVSPFPDAEEDAHPVYELRRLLGGDAPLIIDGAGEADVQVEGIVKRLNYAKRGEVNGVILDTGDFVHLRPHGARVIELEVGQKLTAHGEVRPGWAGCRVIEATIANSIRLEKPKKKHGPPHHDRPHHDEPRHDGPHHHEPRPHETGPKHQRGGGHAEH